MKDIFTEALERINHMTDEEIRQLADRAGLVMPNDTPSIPEDTTKCEK